MKTLRRSVGALLLFFICSTPALAAIKKGPYLVYEGQNTSMDVLWQTDVTESNVIRWGTDTSYGLGQATSAEYGTDHQHKFAVAGLQPGTKYYYQVDGYGSGSFRTAPASSATSVKILAFGDTRTYPANQESVASRMRSAYAADPAFQTLVLHDGDWVAGDTETDWTGQFFVPGSSYPQIHALQAEVPIEGARGNHEGTGTYFKKYYPYPYAGGFYWSYDYGPVHVTVIDQYVSYTPGSAEYNWLTNDLATTTKPWKFLLFHEPGWSAGGSHANNATVQTYIQPLCKQYGVDLVINGHNHYYSRAVVDGVQHITTGGGGAPLYVPDPTYPNIVATDQSFHYLEIDVQGATLNLAARRANGTVIETLTLSHGATNLPPVANAGPDQTVVDADRNGVESVILDGSASYDPDGAISTYTWKEGTATLATAVTAAVDFSVGTHTVSLTVADNQGATATDTEVVTVQTAAAPGAFTLLSPANGKGQVSKTPSFDWSDSAGASTYSIVVSTNSDLSSPVINQAGLTSSSFTSGVTLASKTTYYWKVTATNAYGSTSSSVFSFTTKR